MMLLASARLGYLAAGLPTTRSRATACNACMLLALLHIPSDVRAGGSESRPGPCLPPVRLPMVERRSAFSV
jgi:hypothetical protein